MSTTDTTEPRKPRFIRCPEDHAVIPNTLEAHNGHIEWHNALDKHLEDLRALIRTGLAGVGREIDGLRADLRNRAENSPAIDEDLIGGFLGDDDDTDATSTRTIPADEDDDDYAGLPVTPATVGIA
jgi:hypothetical protein